MSEFTYYNFNEISKQNKLFNFVITPRSAGKTIAFKQRAVERGLDGQRFVYVRRRSTEISSSKMMGFFDKMQKFYFSDINLEYQNGHFYHRVRAESDDMSKKGEILEETLLGYAVSLSTGINERSVDFVDVTDIYFEEFVLTPDSHHNYLEDEVFKFLELYSTIAREDEVRVWFLGNKLQEYNPYFLYFDIKPPTDGIKCWKDFAVECWQDLRFIEHKENTRFGRLVEGTAYADYAIKNVGFENNYNFCRPLPKRAHPYVNVLYNGQWYTLYICQDATMQIAEHLVDCDDKTCIDVKDMSPQVMHFKTYRKTMRGSMIRKALEHNKFFYQSPKSEEVFRVIAKSLYF